MRTNIEIDDKLMADAMRFGKYPTKRAAVEDALRQMVDRQKFATALRKLRGKVEFDSNYDYKAMRQNRFPDWQR